jgi:Carboxypeptidase regulatory-like domain
MRRVSRILLACAWMVVLPSAVHAQGSITGVVRDTSGAVLPGVTVEASSPALIEKIRSVVTDGTGQYRIVDLRPGSYTLSFMLPGFSVVRREGIELTAGFTATVNAELRVGAVEETLTVTGESPIVDVQSTTRATSLGHDVIDPIPTGRNVQQYAVLLTGVTVQSSLTLNSVGGQDVGGSTGNAYGRMSIHGSRGVDQKVFISGLSTMLSAMSQDTPYIANMGSTQEMTIDTAGISAEMAEGGLRVSIVPKEGGNSFHGSVFGSFANEAMSSSNFSEELQARGFLTPNAVRVNGDFNPAFGGPIVQHKLWFFGAYRRQLAKNWVGGIFHDISWNDPNVHSLNQDTSRRVSVDGVWNEGNGRLTWQATPKHKIGVWYAKEHMCTCPSAIRVTTSPGFDNLWGRPHNLATMEWSAPITTRLLFEAGLLYQKFVWSWEPLEGTDPAVIGHLEQSTGVNFKSRPGGYARRWQHDRRFRAAVSYITGAHAFKVGATAGNGDADNLLFLSSTQNYYMRLNNGVPNLITQYATPYFDNWRLNHEIGLYAQDKWTIRGLTLTGGVRFDAIKASFPEETYGPIQFAPARNFTLPEDVNANWKDVTPRLGAAWDAFGNGRTALKVSLNKYLIGVDSSAFRYGQLAPYNRIVHSTTRTWNDVNVNFVPDCDLTSRVANGECGAMANPNLGQPILGTIYDKDAIIGWGKRPFNWEFATSVQQQILPRVSVEAGYFRRWYGNFGATDILGVEASDFDSYCISAPVDSRLPGGGGNQICGLYDLKPTKFGVATQNLTTLSSNYGKEIEHWNGVDVSLDARLTGGVRVQAGVSTGRTSTDNCEIVAKLPEVFSNATTALPADYCHVDSPFLTQVKGMGSYTIPKVDVQIAGAFQSNPGPVAQATFIAPSALAVPSLGRALSGGANVQVNLLKSNAIAETPGTATSGVIYGDRVNQIDLRIGKIVRLGQRRVSANVDVYNVFNSNAVLIESTAYRTYRAPQFVMTPRFVKISAQLDF